VTLSSTKPLPRRTKIRQKSRKRETHYASPQGRSDLAYLGLVRSLPCCICEAFGMTQTSPTEAHHPICERHSSERTPDREAIPLCMCHHQGLRFDRDRSKLAIHQVKESWAFEYGSDRDWIAATQDKIAALAA